MRREKGWEAMKRHLYKDVLLGTVLAFAGAAVAQLSPSPQGSAPQQTPPTFPQSSQRMPTLPSQQPANPAGTVQGGSTQLEYQINGDLHSDAVLAGSNVQATVSATQVVLNGTALSETQHQRALRIASSDAGIRNVVDRITTGGAKATPQANEPNEPQ
jgi:hypothetical protein